MRLCALRPTLIAQVVFNEQRCTAPSHWLLLTRSAFSASKYGFKGFDVVGVVCGKGGKMTWGVFVRGLMRAHRLIRQADANAQGNAGEASINLARTCFGNRMTGNSGHDDGDVLCATFVRSSDLTRTDFAFPGQVDPHGGTNYAARVDRACDRR